MTIGELDQNLFLKINKVWTHPWLDQIMPILTDLHKQKIFVMLAVVGLVLLIYQYRLHAVSVLVGVVLTFAITDTVSHHLVKSFFKRDRPEFAHLEPILRTGSHSGYSFPSNHAANNFAVASFLGFIFPLVRGPLMLIAFVIAYSRIYVGVHYPGDVLGGAVLGIALSFVSRWVWLWMDSKIRLWSRGRVYGERELDEDTSRKRIRDLKNQTK